MSEELHQRDLIKNPPKIKNWHFYNIGATTMNALKKHGIIPSVDYGALGKRKPDGLIALNQKVIAVIENKLPTEFNTEKKRTKAINQSLDLAIALDAAILIVTDTIDTIWINPKTGQVICDEENSPIVVAFDPASNDVGNLIKKIVESVDETNSAIIPTERKDPSSLARQIWQDIWSVSGATPENCLYTFVELFIFKYLSDLNVLTGFYNFYDLLKRYETNSDEQVLEFYADVIRKEIKSKFKKSDRDNTTIINGTIFVSKDEKAVQGYSTVFRKILEKFEREGKLGNIHHDFKSKLFESFLKESISKKNWGQYFTPLKVVRAIVDMVEVKEGMKICDPACGVGKFLLEPVLKDLDRLFPVVNNKIVPKVELYGFDKGFDYDEQKTIILAKANMLIYFSDLIKEHPGISEEFSSLFNKTFLLKTNSILGTLSDPIEDEFDLILTNPPYVTSGSSNLKEEVAKSGLDSYFKTNSLGVEGLFLEWIIRALKPGGKAFVVVPDGLFIRKYDMEMRSFIMKECFIDAIISLPIKTFFTTNKKTFILAITKKLDRSVQQDDPVFTYLVSDIGETLDINRFEIDRNDLEAAVNLFNQFKGAKKHFVSNDSRCKAVPFDELEKDAAGGWFIDEKWSKQERIDLGIIEKDELLSLTDFSSLIGEISSSLTEYQEQLAQLAQKKKIKDQFKQFLVADLFDVSLGDPKYTRKYIDAHKGEYPVYSASNNGPLGYMRTYDHDCDAISWARNGFAGFLTIHSGKFSINYDRGLMIPKVAGLHLPYIRLVLEPVLRNIAQGRKTLDGKDEFTKVYLSTIQNIEIPLPVDAKGNILFERQTELFNDLQVGNYLQEEVKGYISQIHDLKVDMLDDLTDSSNFAILSVFDCFKGSSDYTKKYIRENPGEYPVYSSQTVNEGLIGSIDSYDYDGEYITWTTDGIHAGTPFMRNGKFSMTTHCGALKLKDEFDAKVSVEYVYFYLKSFLKDFAVGEQNKRLTLTIMGNKVTFPLPINADGEIDFEKQQEVVTKMKTVEQIRSMLLSKLEIIRTSNIQY